MIDPDAFEDFVSSYFVSAVSATVQDDSGGRFKRLLTVIRTLYRAIEPSSVPGSITVFGTTTTKTQALPGSFRTLGSIEEVRPRLSNHLCLEVMESGAVREWNVQKLLDLSTLSTNAIVYSYQAGAETFWANRQRIPVHNVYPGEHSLFQLPVYQRLEQALTEYKEPVVRLSECEILANIWFDDLRMFLKPKPESTMRKSLTRFLRWQLRADAEVMPEQNVDETHPIDIRVTFNFHNRVALLEIKWMGYSKNTSGAPTTQYGPARANSGASQLAGYLDRFQESLPNRISRGYLVVFDCRRRGLSSDPPRLSRREGFYFSNCEISYNPAFHLKRRDFAEPIRMFAEPICY